MTQKNILLGKLGKSINFRPSSWSLQGGQEGIYSLINLLSDLNPDINFYIAGKTNIEKLSVTERNTLFSNKNVYFLPDCTKDYTMQYNFLKKNNIKLDVAILMCGMSTSVSIPNKVYGIKDSTKYREVLNWSKQYCAPINHILNETMVPFFTISEDPRNTVLKSKDILNVERKCLSQENSEYTRRYLKSFDDQSPDNMNESIIPVEYAHIELLSLYKKPKHYHLKNINNRTDTLNIFMNEYGLTCQSSRKPFVEEWIIPNFPDAKIYGLWKNETRSCFLNKKIVDIPEVLHNTKYTVVKSLKPNFVTNKPWEMINYGIIPFLSPEYDGHKLLPLPDFLYLTDKQDLIEKIELLESKPQYYLDLWYTCQRLLKPEYFSGKFLNDILLSNVSIYL